MIFPEFIFLLMFIPVPIILHFISKRLLRKKDFPSLLFILKSDSRLMRWFLLKRLFLLFLRIGIVLSLIFAAANVLIPVSFYEIREKTILDKSLSMRNIDISNIEVDVKVPNRGGKSLIREALKEHSIGILISDAQKDNFKELLKREERYPGIDLNKVPLPRGNIGIIGHQIGPSFINQEINLVFTVLNQPADLKKVLVSLYIDDKIIEKNELSIKEKINKIKFSTTLSVGTHKGYLLINDKDGFDYDNIHYFTIFLSPVINVNIYSKQYPQRLIAVLDPYYFQVSWKKEFSKEDKSDIIIVDDFPFKQILDNIESSKPAIICVKDKEESFFAREIPYKISKINNVNSFYPLKDLKELSNIPIRYNSKLIGGKTLLYFDNGDPFLIQENSIIILPFSLNESNLSLYPIYVPFLYKLISYIQGNNYKRDLQMDQKVVLETSFKPIIYSPDNRKYIPLSISNNKYLFVNTEKPGIYEIWDELKLRGYISVNPDPAESYLDTLSKYEIKRLFGEAEYSNGATFFLVIGLLLFILSIIIERK
jgi:hypothetical protein